MTKARTPEEIASAAPFEVIVSIGLMWKAQHAPTLEEKQESQNAITEAIALWAANEALREKPRTPEEVENDAINRAQLLHDIKEGKIAIFGSYLVVNSDDPAEKPEPIAPLEQLILGLPEVEVEDIAETDEDDGAILDLIMDPHSSFDTLRLATYLDQKIYVYGVTDDRNSPTKLVVRLAVPESNVPFVLDTTKWKIEFV